MGYHPRSPKAETLGSIGETDSFGEPGLLNC